MPRQQWAYAWRVRIINLSISLPEVRHLWPFVVFVSPAGDGIFKTNCAESLGKNICRDFDLDIRQVLWMEHFPDAPEEIYTAVFRPQSYYGPEMFYDVGWRPIRPNELAVIKPFIPEIADIQAP